MSFVFALMLSPLAAPEAGCVETFRDIAAGEVLSPDMVRRVECRSSKTARLLRYDAGSRTVTAVSTLPARTYLGRLTRFESSAVSKGTRLTLRSVSGPAIVERQVVTLQSGRSGQRIFVIDTDGRVFAAKLRVDGVQGSAQ